MYPIRRSFYAATLGAICLLHSVIADPQINWLFPSSGPVQTYNRNDIFNASWITSMGLMPTLISLCQESTNKDITNISYSYVHSTGSKLIPLDLWAGGNYPYICKFDFIDSGDNCQLDNPSNSFYISDTPNASPKIWSQDGTAQFVQDSSTNSSGSTPPLRNSKGASTARSSGLSSGAIAGAVVGAMIGGALIAGIGTFFWLRRQSNRDDTNFAWSHQGCLPQNTTLDAAQNEEFGIQGKDAGAYAPIPEMGEGRIMELEAGKRGSRLGSP
ncbi:MAG: hypothetical protein LQ349_008159 [Xanthoria aureola]|nr:MAG: hypothetical protein LQ349_008159 [Xanthoria aureola]